MPTYASITACQSTWQKFRALAWDVYISMKNVVTSSISTNLGVAIFYQLSCQYNFRSVNYSCGGRTNPRPSRFSYTIVIDIADRASMTNEPHPLFEGLTKNQFPLLLPKLTFVKMTLANRGSLTVACDAYPAIAADAGTGT